MNKPKIIATFPLTAILIIASFVAALLCAGCSDSDNLAGTAEEPNELAYQEQEDSSSSEQIKSSSSSSERTKKSSSSSSKEPAKPKSSSSTPGKDKKNRPKESSRPTKTTNHRRAAFLPAVLSRTPATETRIRPRSPPHRRTRPP